MWLVLCEANDAPAHWAFDGLRKRGLLPLELITSEDLARPARWEHYVSTSEVYVSVQLHDGRTISSPAICGALNRLVMAPLATVPDVVPDDQSYACQELAAFFLSWLNALPGPLLNRPTAVDLSGNSCVESEWVRMAQQSGLPTAPYFESSARWRQNAPHATSDTVPRREWVFVIRDKSIGRDLPAHIQKGCVRLAEVVSVDLLGVELALNEKGEWTFQTATVRPDLRLGGQALLDALACIFTTDKGLE